MGIKHAGERYIITQDLEGRFILEKAILIPEREAWLHQNKKAKEAVFKGLAQAKNRNVKKMLLI